MKKNILTFALTMLLFCAIGCEKQPEAPIGEPPPSLTDGNVVSEGSWETVCGTYTWEESAQYSNATLSMMWLESGCVLFDFDLMQGSESENDASSLHIPGVLNIQEDGTGLYEITDDDGTALLSIRFGLSDDGQSVHITHEGDLPISPDGSYIFMDSGLEVSDTAATELLSFLPAAATSLSGNTGEYTLRYPEELLGDWFYPVEAIFEDTGTALAKFLVAKDLSAVFRVDDDMEPVLIYGSAQPMLDAETWVESSADAWEEAEGETPAEEAFSDISSLVSVVVADDAFLVPGETANLTAVMPWTLPYTIEAVSSDPTIVEVGTDGVLRGCSVGETTIAGTLYVADGVKEFSLTITVEETEAFGSDIGDAAVFARTRGRWQRDGSDDTASIVMDGYGGFETYYASGAKEFEGYLIYMDEYEDGNGRYDMYLYDETEPRSSFYFHSDTEFHMGNGDDGEVYILDAAASR